MSWCEDEQCQLAAPNTCLRADSTYSILEDLPHSIAIQILEVVHVEVVLIALHHLLDVVLRQIGAFLGLEPYPPRNFLLRLCPLPSAGQSSLGLPFHRFRRHLPHHVRHRLRQSCRLPTLLGPKAALNGIGNPMSSVCRP